MKMCVLQLSWDSNLYFNLSGEKETKMIKTEKELDMKPLALEPH